MRTRSLDVFYAFVLLFVANWVGLDRIRGDTPSIQSIGAAWKQRQDKFSSISVKWSDEERVAARSIPPGDPTGEFLPDQDLDLSKDTRFMVSGSKMRYEYKGTQYNPSRKEVHTKQYISVANGKISKNFHIHFDGNLADYPMSGFIAKTASHWDIGNREIVPFIFFCRPLDRSLGGVAIEDYSIGKATAEIGGHTCVELSPNSVKGPYRMVFWVAPSAEFNCLRITYGRKDLAPMCVWEIKYGQSQNGFLIPTSWELIEEGGNLRRIFRQIKARVGSIDFSKEIDENQFDFEFPPDTAVVDSRTNERFISRADGEKRVVTKAELLRGAKYNDLISSESDEALQSPRRK